MKSLLVMIAAAVVLFGASAILIASKRHPGPPSALASAGATALVIDATDPLTPSHLVHLRARLRKLGEGLRRGERLSVFVLSGDSPSPRELQTITNPGRGCDAHPFTEGAAVLDRRFATEVLQQLDSLVTVVARCDTSRQSAILEALWQITHYSDFAHQQGPRHLVLVSDLIENTRSFSLYSQGNADFFSANGTLQDDRWVASLKGASVDVICLLRPRDAPLQGPSLFSLWARYFEHCGATSTTFLAVGS